jgi:leader peptidase (prepilin peptidase) / N-methyltransferase
MMFEVERTIVLSEENLRPNLAILFGGGVAIAILSFLWLPVAPATASVLLGLLMIAGAQVDARTYLLPNAVTWGGIASGILIAPALDSLSPWWSSAGAGVVRATATAVAFLLLRWCYTWLRAREGLGLGDVKLAAAAGAWLPAASIPLCFALATCSALVAVALAGIRGERVDSTAKLPFGAFLCPALWLVFFASELQS